MPYNDNMAQNSGDSWPQRVQKAGERVADGEVIEGATDFAALAADADTAQLRRRSANLRVQAAMAYVRAGNGPEALSAAVKALNTLRDLDLYHRAVGFYMTLTQAVEARKLARTLDALRTEFSHQAVILTGEMRKYPLPARKLPTYCPGCDLPMRTDAVDWITPMRAECDYCGTVVDAVAG
jgi:hypothetical protein